MLIQLPLQGSDGGISLFSEVHELHTNIHKVLYSAVFRLVGNTDFILAYIFNSSRQSSEV